MKQKLSENFDYSGEKMKIGIVAAQFNNDIVDPLLQNTLGELKRLKVVEIKVIRVPGALEIPVATQNLIKNNKLNAIITLGTVIKGETDHYEHVSRESIRALVDLSLKLDIPIIQGILTVNTREQAEERIKRGVEFARSAIQMANILK